MLQGNYLVHYGKERRNYWQLNQSTATKKHLRRREVLFLYYLMQLLVSTWSGDINIEGALDGLDATFSR
ncbi:hypothetical protein [Pseudomonas syringae group sp. J309-1]|uniref:hypothetical protein n=1 Tax=Pseudomonas syringae group sp. J309-1 TaxID=3079588 RepID=UPI002915A9BD|nr:hypothetical protein [Pseudomonas syringae group sp. J309-1]MDU8359278.1 hypothetical protein [Pseudomonas syringae group sp. J309-1]